MTQGSFLRCLMPEPTQNLGLKVTKEMHLEGKGMGTVTGHLVCALNNAWGAGGGGYFISSNRILQTFPLK